MSTKTFTVTGYTTKNGVTKIRWARDIIRQTKLFKKEECEPIHLISLPHSMTKLEALDFIKTHPDFQEPKIQEVIVDSVKYRKMVAEKASGTYTAKKRGRPRKSVVTADMIVQISKEVV